MAPPAEPPTDLVAYGGATGWLDHLWRLPFAQERRCAACRMVCCWPAAPSVTNTPTTLPLDEETGIGSWSAEEIASFMQTGTFPDGSQAEGAMAQQIERRFSALTDGDAAAIAAYLKSTMLSTAGLEYPSARVTINPEAIRFRVDGAQTSTNRQKPRNRLVRSFHFLCYICKRW
ncbi:MAG: hypothetical protein R2911_25000 [Caldilineaceae bacterium]